MSYSSQPQPDDARWESQPPSAPNVGSPQHAHQPYSQQPPSPPVYGQPVYEQQPYSRQVYGQQHGAVQPYGGPGAAVGADQAAALAILGRKSAGVAAILSVLLVGAGQMYCGHVGRGLVFLGAAFFSGLLMFVLIGFLLVPIVFLWALLDAISLTNRHNMLLAHRLGVGRLP